MSTNRGTLRKNRSTNKEGNQSISNFTEKRSRDDCVEIIEEDEDDDQFLFADQTPTRPLSMRRKKKPIIVDKSDEEDNNSNVLGDTNDMDEDEKQQLEEAMRQSCLEMERDAKRRAIYSMFETSNFRSETEMPTTSGADLPSSPTSSPTSSGIEHQCPAERPESPDLFGTPQSTNDNDKDVDIPDNPSSPKNVCSSSVNMTKSPFEKEINIKLTPIGRKLSLKKGKEPIEEQSSRDIKREKEKAHTTDTKKRKHIIDDESDDDGYDGAKQHHTESIPVESRKKQKTIEDNFPVLSPRIQKETKVEKETEQFVIDDDDDDEDFQDNSENTRRRADSTKLKKYFRVRLERTYKKPKLPIKTIRDAVKSRLFFAPPGIDHKLYTYAIRRMLDHTRDCIHMAQQKGLQFVKWGLPIVAGPRVDGTLDAAKKSKRKTNMTVTADEPLESKRSLRSNNSNQSKSTVPTATVKSEPEATNLQPKSKNASHIDSDSDEELTKSVFGDNKEIKPKNWKEYSSRSECKTFGENINTSVSFNEKDYNTKETKTVDHVERNSGIKDKEPVVDRQGKKTTELDEKRDSIHQQESEKQTSETYDRKSISTEENNKATCSSWQDSQTEQITDQNAANSKEDQERMEQQREFSRNDFQYSHKQNETLQHGDDDIDSSAEIGRKKKRHESKVPVINDEEVDSTCQEADVEMIDIDEYSSSDSGKATKPGELLTNTAEKSGFLKAKRNSNNPPVIQRKVSTAAKRAAEAAERRFNHPSTVTTSSSQEITSNIEPSQAEIPSKENLVECPICYAHFPLGDIETHAATCNGTPPVSNEEVYSSRRGLSDQQSSASTSTDPTVQQNQEYGLKKLHVVMTNSPEAQNRFKEQRDLSSLKAKRNMSLKKHEKPERSGNEEKGSGYTGMTCNQEYMPRRDEVDNSQIELGSEGNSQKVVGLKNLQVVVTRSPEAQRRVKEQRDLSSSKAKRNLSLTERAENVEKVGSYIDMTCDQDDTPREDIPRVGTARRDTSRKDEADNSQSEDGSQGNSQRFTWWTSDSAEKKKKEKFKVTYGNKKKTVTSPFSTLDFIPLEEKPPSSDSEGDDATEKASVKNRKEKRSLRHTTADELQSTSIPPSSAKANTSIPPSSAKATTSCDIYADIDSDSDSESEMHAGYEVKESKRDGKTTEKSVDVLLPQRQEVTSKNKKKKSSDFDEKDYANEMALMELAGISGKRPRDENQSKAPKRRRKRATISSDDSDENDDREKCFLCGERVMKEIYQQHTESCMKKNPALPGKSTGTSTGKSTGTSTGTSTGKSTGTSTGDVSTSKTSNRKSTRQTAKPTTSSNTVEMDSDEIGDSPIKSFKLIGDEGRSLVDFDNQFAFFKNTRSSSKGGKGARGGGRGKGFKNKPWYKKSYRK